MNTIRTNADQAEFDAESDTRAGPVAARAGLLAGLRHRRYPVVPPVLAAAAAAMARHDTETARLLQTKQESFGAFCTRVATEVLASGEYPADLATSAFEAQRAEHIINAGSVAIEAVRRKLAAMFPAVVTGALPGLLDGLRGELDDVLPALRDADRALGKH